VANLVQQYAIAFVLVLLASVPLVRIASRRHLVAAVITGALAAAVIELARRDVDDEAVEVLAPIVVGAVVVVLLMPRLLAVAGRAPHGAKADSPAHTPASGTGWRWASRGAITAAVLGALGYVIVRAHDGVVRTHDVACFQGERQTATPNPQIVKALKANLESCEIAVNKDGLGSVPAYGKTGQDCSLARYAFQQRATAEGIAAETCHVSAMWGAHPESVRVWWPQRGSQWLDPLDLFVLLLLLSPVGVVRYVRWLRS